MSWEEDLKYEASAPVDGSKLPISKVSYPCDALIEHIRTYMGGAPDEEVLDILNCAAIVLRPKGIGDRLVDAEMDDIRGYILDLQRAVFGLEEDEEAEYCEEWPGADEDDNTPLVDRVAFLEETVAGLKALPGMELKALEEAFAYRGNTISMQAEEINRLRRELTEAKTARDSRGNRFYMPTGAEWERQMGEMSGMTDLLRGGPREVDQAIDAANARALHLERLIARLAERITALENPK